MVELEGSARRLSAEDADPAQVAFSPDGRTLAVTERGTNSISAFAIDAQGLATGPARIRSSGQMPSGFAFTEDGAMIVTEAFGGAVGAASSYSITDPGMLAPVSGSVGDTRSEVCWAAVTNDGHFAYVTNFGDGTTSSSPDCPNRRWSTGILQSPIDGTSYGFTCFDAPQEAPERHDLQYFEMFGNRGVYHKGWSAVTKHRTPWAMAARRGPAVRRRRVGALRRLRGTRPKPNVSPRRCVASSHELQRLWLPGGEQSTTCFPLDDRTAERLNPSIAGRPS